MKVELNLNLKKVFGLGEFSKREIEYREHRETQKSMLGKAYDDTQSLSIENEKDPIFIDIFNKIINGEFKNAKDNNLKGFYKSREEFKILMDNDIKIFIGTDISIGPGKEGWELSDGDSIDYYYMIVNRKRIGSNGYITFDSYYKIRDKIKEFNNF